MRDFSLSFVLSLPLAGVLRPIRRFAATRSGLTNRRAPPGAATSPRTLTVSFQQEMAVQGMNMTHEITETLKEVTPDKATIEFAIAFLAGLVH